MLLHVVCCAVTSGEKVEISCNVFFVGYCVVNLVCGKLRWDLVCICECRVHVNVNVEHRRSEMKHNN